MDYEHIMSRLWATYESKRKTNWLEKRKANPNNKKGRDASNEEWQIKEEEEERDGLER